MDHNFTIYLLVEVILCGFLIPPFINFCIKKIKDNRRKKIKENGLVDFQKGLHTIDHKNPHYDVLCRNNTLSKHYFQHNVLDTIFVIPFPNSKREALIKHGFCPVEMYGREMSSNRQGSKIYEQLKELLTLNGVPADKQEAFITQIAEETADNFITDIKKGKVRFNKYLYGVNDKPTEQNNTCIINVYESDYFTFKTTTSIYNALRKKNGFVILKNKYAPFLNSIGVGGFVIVNRGDGDELIWGYRGSNCQSGGYWHFSYDETFTHDDAANQDQSATLTDCIKRALDEELGINREEDYRCLPESQIIILDGGIIHTDGDDKRFEFELSSFVRVCFSEQYTFDDFIHNYRFAKDAELETRCLKLVKISELDQFINQYEYKISPEAKALAMKIKSLSELNILGTDHEGFQELFPVI